MKEFENWVRKGLGRAVIFLQRNDGWAYRAPLLYACTHDLTYDRQCEDRRGRYLLDLIAASRDEAFYRDAIFNALTGGVEDLDYGQIFEIAGDYARRDDPAMKQAMYSAIGASGYASMGLCAAETLVSLDGLPALVFVAKSFGEEPAGERPWQFRSLIEVLEERDGKQPLPPALLPFLREAEEFDRLWCEAPHPRARSEEELQAVADNVLVETDEQRLVLSLRLFGRRVFPTRIDRLLDLAHSENHRVAHAALMVLRNITDPRIRELGLNILAGSRRAGRGVQLLVRNAGPDDLKLIESALNPDLAPEEIHNLGFGVREYVRAHTSPAAEPLLLFLYEQTPCSHCRRASVELLIEIARVPEWMAEECRYDADLGMRELFSSLQ